MKGNIFVSKKEKQAKTPELFNILVYSENKCYCFPRKERTLEENTY